jgi:hypothetical protein
MIAQCSQPVFCQRHPVIPGIHCPVPAPADLKLILVRPSARPPVVRPRLATGRASPPPAACIGTDFRNTALASAGQYRMNAALMRLERHERGIHVV